MRRIIYILILGLVSVFSYVAECMAENTGYKVIRKDAVIYSDMQLSSEEDDNSAILIKIQKGDTVEAAPGTTEFIAERVDSGFSMLPVVYNGVRGYMKTSALVPIKLSESDSITRIPEYPESKMSGLERSIVKYQDEVLNLPIHPMEWLKIGIWSLLFIVGLVVIRKLKPKFVQNCAIFILIALIVASISEVMYIIGMGNKALFFIESDYVGWFWSKVNFLLLAIVLVCQYALIAFIDDMIASYRVTPSFDADPDFCYLSDSDPKWTRKFIVFYSDFFLLGLIALSLINGFMGNPLSIWVFISLLAVVVFPVIAFIKIGRPLRGIILELMYIVEMIGFVMIIAVLGTKMLWLVATLIGFYLLLLCLMPGGRR